MTVNRSCPPGPVIPCLVYENVPKAIEWLCGAFGFAERLRTPAGPDGSIHHAQLAFGQGSVILSSATPANQGFVRTVMLAVNDVDAHCLRARRFGAKILMEPGTKEFGERQYAAEDLERNRWVFTQSVADVAPETWGAQVVSLARPFQPPLRPSVCYIQIPAADAHLSAGFYEKVFGWNIRHRDSHHPSFDDAAGQVSGGFFTDLQPMREAGLIVSIWVDNIDATLERVTASGGEIAMPRRHDQPDSTSWIAHFRDPAGNLMGLYQED